MSQNHTLLDSIFGASNNCTPYVRAVYGANQEWVAQNNPDNCKNMAPRPEYMDYFSRDASGNLEWLKK